MRGDRIVCFDRTRKTMLDEPGVVAKFGVPPASIPDYLALVGDSADGIPGVPRWGAKSTATVLARYGHLEAIPATDRQWEVKVRGASSLGHELRAHRQAAQLYRLLATLRSAVPLTESVAEPEWQGARRDELEAVCAELGDTNFATRISRWRD